MAGHWHLVRWDTPTGLGENLPNNWKMYPQERMERRERGRPSPSHCLTPPPRASAGQAGLRADTTNRPRG